MADVTELSRSSVRSQGRHSSADRETKVYRRVHLLHKILNFREFGHFALLLRRERQRNVPKCVCYTSCSVTFLSPSSWLPKIPNYTARAAHWKDDDENHKKTVPCSSHINSHLLTETELL